MPIATTSKEIEIFLHQDSELFLGRTYLEGSVVTEGKHSLENTHPSQIEDSVLLEQVAQKNRRAFQEYYNRYAGKLLAFLKTKSPDEELQREVLQEVFVTVWKKAHLFSASKGTSTQWVYTIARNKLFDRWRKIERLKEQTGMEWDQVQDLHCNPNIEEQVLISRVVKELPEEQKILLHMSYYEGKTHKQCSEELNMPLGTFKWKLKNALGELKKKLNLKGETKYETY